MFELVCAVCRGDRSHVMAWRGFSGSQKPQNFQGIQFTVLSCREVSELVTRFYRRRDACFRKPRRIFIRQ